MQGPIRKAIQSCCGPQALALLRPRRAASPGESRGCRLRLLLLLAAMWASSHRFVVSFLYLIVLRLDNLGFYCDWENILMQLSLVGSIDSKHISAS